MPHDRYSLTLNSVLDFAEGHRRVSRESRTGWFSVFQEIAVSHNGIMTPGLIQGNQYDLAVPVLLAKCSFAYYVAAVDVGLSRQVLPCFALLRMCIESVVYAHAIIGRPELSKVWVLRDNTLEDKKNFDAEFKISDLINALPETGAAPRDVIWKLYRRAISYGGHPNRNGALSIAGVDHTQGRFSIDVEVFSQGLPFMHALKSIAEVGYGMVCLEDLMFNVTLAPGTLPDRIRALSDAGLGELDSQGKELTWRSGP